MFLAIEQLMIIARPGVGGEYDPGKPIDGKGSDFFDENEDELIRVIQLIPLSNLWRLSNARFFS